MKTLQAVLATSMLLIAFAAVAAGVKQVQGTVVHIASSYGNIDTSFVPDDLVALGIKKGDSFRVGFGKKRFDVYLGETYSDVPKGDWVAFITSKGNLRIARNMDDAATTLGVKKGDTITLYH